MCFSAQASFMASATLIFISALCFKKAQNTPQRLLASSPLFFGIQQALEGIVWITLNQAETQGILHTISVHGFLFFAYVFWPVYMPIAVYLLEKTAWRKKFIRRLGVIGCLVALAGIVSLIISGYNAYAAHNHIVYAPTRAYTLFSVPVLIAIQYGLLALYTIAIIGSLIISSVPYMWICGALIALGFIIAQIHYAAAFGSVWCFFGAITSVVIYFILSTLTARR